jgi:hypothetical protein
LTKQQSSVKVTETMEETMLVLRVIEKNYVNGKQIVSTNPPAIPRVGDKVDMGYAPAPTVREVLWDFGKGVSSDTTVTAVVD